MNKLNFETTDWSVVKKAAAGAVDHQAWSQIVESYWFPCYTFVRRRGLTSHDAEDRIQQFFMELLESGVLDRACSERGRFRSFLLAALKQFLARQHRYETAKKRMPNKPIVELSVAIAEKKFCASEKNASSPEEAFDHAWASEVLAKAMAELESYSNQRGRAKQFAVIKHFLSDQNHITAREAAKKLGITEIAVRAAAYRLKSKLAEYIRIEVAATLPPGSDVDLEVRTLASCLSKKL